MRSVATAAPSRRAILAAAGAPLLPPATGQGQPAEGYPSRPVTVVVPFAPGGMADILARALSHVLQQNLGRPFVVVSRTGGAGTVGIRWVAASPPDGTTLLLTLSSISALPVIAELEGRPEPFRRGQFSPLARLAADPALLYVNRDAPWQTVEDLVSDARRNPGKLTFVSSGQFGPTHIPMEMLLRATGSDMLHVPLNGGAPAMTMLLSRQVDVFFTIPGLGMSHVRNGDLRVLATSARERLAMLPEVPTLLERGIDVEYSVWAGMFARSDVPPAIRDLLAEALRRAVADPVYAGALDRAGILPAYLGPAAFAAFWDADVERTERIIRGAPQRSAG